jgi:hypothetical protein
MRICVRIHIYKQMQRHKSIVWTSVKGPCDSYNAHRVSSYILMTSKLYLLSEYRNMYTNRQWNLILYLLLHNSPRLTRWINFALVISCLSCFITVSSCMQFPSTLQELRGMRQCLVISSYIQPHLMDNFHKLICSSAVLSVTSAHSTWAWKFVRLFRTRIQTDKVVYNMVWREIFCSK